MSDVDKDYMWDLLSSNYSKLAHAWGQELAALSKRKNKQHFHARAEECLKATLLWPVEARSRTVKTWLSIYQLPLDQNELESFTHWHELTSPYVFSNMKTIQSYDQPT